MTTPKQGPLSVDELLAVWRSAVDPSYSEPLVNAGDGSGIEAYVQGFEQHARASRAVDVTTQAMFLLPWSGQTAPPAGGARGARVTLTLARSLRVHEPLVIEAGNVLVGEVTTDWGRDGSVEVLTGRRYFLDETLVFFPGDVGPYDVQAEAELPGYGFNNPLPGTIARFAQLGVDYANDLASVVVASPAPAYDAVAKATLVTDNTADTLIPEHSAQYVLFTGGANAGKVGRLTAYAPPDASVNRGGSAELELLATVEGTLVGAFAAGERVRWASGYGRLVADRASGSAHRAAFVVLSGSIADGDVVTGDASGAALTVTFVSHMPSYAAEAPAAGVVGAAWRVLDWDVDWGLTSTNALSPEGGRAAMLDVLTEERGLPRLAGEDDEALRQRGSEVADVVTPNALRRALNRAIPGLSWCLREAGQGNFPGIFYDRAEGLGGYDDNALVYTGVVSGGAFEQDQPVEYRRANSDFVFAGWAGRKDGPDGVATLVLTVRGSWDAPAVLAGDVVVAVRPTTGAQLAVGGSIANALRGRRFRCYLDYEQFRGFFVVGVPRVSAGEFGFAWDVHPLGAYDSSPWWTFFDGYASSASATYRRVYDALDKTRAGGVGFELYLEDGACV